MTHRIVEARRRLNPKDGYRAYLDKSSSWSRDLGFRPACWDAGFGLDFGEVVSVIKTRLFLAFGIRL